MPTRSRRHRVVTLIGAAVVGAFAAGCAGSPAESDAAGDQQATQSPATSAMQDMGDMGDMGGMGNMMMNDPDATPAGELPGATESPLVLLDTRPPGTDGVQGSAWLALGEQAPGTTLTVALTGLEPGAEFVGHLHAQPCAEDNGGPHFKFDPAGSDMPPNEVHIGFTAAPDGTGGATITNEQRAGEARAVVIHPADAQDNRLACADF